MVFSNVIVEVTISSRSFVFCQTLKMTTAQVVETSVTVTNSSFQNYTHPDDHTTRTTDTPGFKPFTKISKIDCSSDFTFPMTTVSSYMGF